MESKSRPGPSLRIAQSFREPGVLLEDMYLLGRRLKDRPRSDLAFGTAAHLSAPLPFDGHARNTAAKLLPERWRPKVAGSALDVEGVPMCPSFMHLHVGFRADDQR
jgi:hypothetical protein